MDARTQVLAVDFTLAALAVALGILGNGLAPALATPPLVVFVAMFVLTLVVVAGRTVVPAPVATLLSGMGVGLAGYRTVYGLLRPLPERRIAQARWLGGTDEYGLNPP